jgi:UDP-N-acetylmuramoyl-tripeptide--D-alanyl-D-alanine ligase
MDIQKLHQLFIESEGICTDTRKIEKGTIFFALKGDNFNGNKYANQALISGCKYAVVDEKEFAIDNRFILVDSVLNTLQKLANFHRKQFDIPVIGITGSNGKTTTKELIGEVLKQKYNVLITKGNLNNHLGVPFTLLNLNDSHQIAIIEMGANKPKDISELVDIAEPTHGIITNIGTAHIEGFGSFEGVLNTKLELYNFILNSNGHIFVNKDDKLLMSHLPNVKFSTYSSKSDDADVVGELVELTPYVNFKWKANHYQSLIIKTNLVGGYNFTNFLASICIGQFFNVENEQINKALSNYQPSNNRSQVIKTNRNTLIVDCYNANPTSMLSALESFKMINHKNKLVVLGDMLELGKVSVYEHQQIIDWLDENEINGILVGENFNRLNSKFKTFKTINNLKEVINLSDFNDYLILLKGSRGIALEKLIESL